MNYYHVNKVSDDPNFDPELEFISGKIFDINLPKDKLYLYRYFVTARQRSFVKYYLTYGEYTRFMDHTGYACSKKWLKNLRQRLIKLQQLHDKAKEDGDFTTLACIESGKYAIYKKKKKRVKTT